MLRLRQTPLRWDGCPNRPDFGLDRRDGVWDKRCYVGTVVPTGRTSVWTAAMAFGTNAATLGRLSQPAGLRFGPPRWRLRQTPLRWDGCPNRPDFGLDRRDGVWDKRCYVGTVVPTGRTSVWTAAMAFGTNAATLGRLSQPVGLRFGPPRWRLGQTPLRWDGCPNRSDFGLDRRDGVWDKRCYVGTVVPTGRTSVWTAAMAFETNAATLRLARADAARSARQLPPRKFHRGRTT